LGLKKLVIFKFRIGPELDTKFLLNLALIFRSKTSVRLTTLFS